MYALMPGGLKTTTSPPLSLRLRRSLETWRARIAALVFCILAAGAGWLVYEAIIGDPPLAAERESPGWTREQVTESMSRARRLIRALNQYRDQHGTYPTELSAVAPRLVALIEPPTTGNRRWTYFRYNQGKAFYLGFSSGRDHTRAMSYASHRSPPWGKGDTTKWVRAREDE
jgi:hypothetical protein